METNRLSDMVISLIGKTKKDGAVWRGGNRSGEFIISMSSGAMVVYFYHGNFNRGNIDFTIFNADGNEIESQVFIEGEAEYADLFELYSVIRRKYYKVDETIDGMLKELNSSNIVGKVIKGVEEDSNEDDVLPF